MDMSLRLKRPGEDDLELCELIDKPGVCYKSDVCTELKSEKIPVCPITKVSLITLDILQLHNALLRKDTVTYFTYYETNAVRFI